MEIVCIPILLAPIAVFRKILDVKCVSKNMILPVSVFNLIPRLFVSDKKFFSLRLLSKLTFGHVNRCAARRASKIGTATMCLNVGISQNDLILSIPALHHYTCIRRISHATDPTDTTDTSTSYRRKLSWSRHIGPAYPPR